MSKIKITKDVLYITSNKPITWKAIKDFQFEDDDVLNIQYEEPFYTENNSNDGGYYCLVQRMIEETDEEYEKRMEDKKRISKNLRKLRYQQYLKLKQEFENE